MAFTNGQNVQAADLNNFSVTTVTTTGDVTVGDDITVTDDATIGGDCTITGTLTVGGQVIAGVSKNTACGRLTLTTAVPVTTTDVTAATTLYYALYTGNEIALYNGTTWQTFSISELSIAVPATTSQMYDVFVNYNAGTPALALTAWTNDTTRATALTTQNGVLVKSGSTTQRYVGSFRTTGVSGQTEDSLTKRYVWNYYNRVDRALQRLETTASWSYNTATIRQANNSATNQVDVIVGVQEDPVILDLHAQWGAAADTSAAAGIGLDSTSTFAGNQHGISNQTGTLAVQIHSKYRGFVGVGRHVLSWNERGNGGAAITWYGTGVITGIGEAQGLLGSVKG